MVEQFTHRDDAVAEIRTRLSPTGVWMILGATIFVVSTVVLILTMERWPDPYVGRSAATAIFYPIGPGPKAMPAVNADLLDVYATDESNVWVVGKNALIAHSTDGGATWEKAMVINPLASRPRLVKETAQGTTLGPYAADAKLLCVEHENLVSIGEQEGTPRFSRELTAIGAAGGVYETSDGKSWRCIAKSGGSKRNDHLRMEKGWHFPTRQTIRGVEFRREYVGWAVGDHGVILHTTDGGKTWRHQTRESTYNESLLPGSPLLPILPPWYLIANTFSAYAFFRSRTEAQKKQRSFSQQWIDSKGERDSPLEPGDAEASNLDPLAKAIADFIRNPETKPPMTVAVTGTWGSGKSSLMNLIRYRLMKSAWRPVWFNAWHHQKEESLLAALLQTIRMQAVPKLWERGGPSFYTRLFLIRLRNYQARVVATAMLVCFTAGFVMTYPLILDRLKDHSSTGHGLIERIGDFFPPATANLVLSLGTIITVLYSLFKGLNAFGVKPAELLADVSSGARIKDLDAQMSFRERFAREFREVTDALNPWRSLLIFIDDLDRCHPNNVVEVLEAVNFLVTSGDCFVILGMARDKVQPAVGLAFKEMAAEMDLPPGSTLTGDEAARERRKELAHDYLDKLINFEVAVPRQSADASLRALTREETPVAKQWWHIDPLRAASIAALSAITVLLPLSMLFSGITAATMAYVHESEHDRQYIVRRAFERKPIEPSAPAPATAPVQANAVSTQPGTIARAAEVRDRWMYWPIFVPLITLLWIVIWLLRRADDEVVRDSDEFTEALKIWHPVLYEHLRTPRAMKRFKNKLRFAASRVRAHAAAPEVREHAIVAASAIRLGYRDFDTFYKSPHEAPFSTCFMEHANKFGEEDLRQFDLRFDEVAADVQFR